MRATVLTSATLTVEGSFAYVRGRLGVPKAAEVSVAVGVRLRRRRPCSTCRAACRRPSRRSSATRPRARCWRSCGAPRAARSCCSRATACCARCTSLVDDALPYPLLVQGEAPRSVLLQRFRTTPHAVLLATSSFWQGVDVVGEQLSCVIIDKLPFASPGDPITAARVEAITADGGDAVPRLPGAAGGPDHAAGPGPADPPPRRPRACWPCWIHGSGPWPYGRRFLHSFPPAPVTHDLDRGRAVLHE